MNKILIKKKKKNKKNKSLKKQKKSYENTLQKKKHDILTDYRETIPNVEKINTMAGKYSFKSTYNELYTLEEEYNDLEKKLNDSNIKYEILKKKYDRDISIKDKLE